MEIEAIKLYLQSNKISYSELSSKSGVPINTLKSIFSRRTPNPRIDTLRAIEEALGLNEKVTNESFPVSYEEFEKLEKNKGRLDKIASLPLDQQKILFSAIDAMIEGFEKKK